MKNLSNKNLKEDYMIYNMLVTEVSYLENPNQTLVTCQDRSTILSAICSKTLSPKIGDRVYVLHDPQHLNYYGYDAVATQLVK